MDSESPEPATSRAPMLPAALLTAHGIFAAIVWLTCFGYSARAVYLWGALVCVSHAACGAVLLVFDAILVAGAVKHVRTGF